jgi:hypothetical protein
MRGMMTNSIDRDQWLNVTSESRDRIYTRNVLDMDCQTQGRLKLMIELYISEICHKFQ